MGDPKPSLLKPSRCCVYLTTGEAASRTRDKELLRSIGSTNFIPGISIVEM